MRLSLDFGQVLAAGIISVIVLVVALWWAFHLPPDAWDDEQDETEQHNDKDDPM